jgi:sigma-B regulation protein RsbU (phosphoserine phosphatase)
MSPSESKSSSAVLRQPARPAEASPLAGGFRDRESTQSLDYFLLDLADALNSTLDLDALLQRVAELVKRAIHYEIFAILLLNERTQELRMRFQIGHSAEAERVRVKVGHGITGVAVQERRAVLANDVSQEPNYINVHPAVRSELAVPLITKNRVIGVIDIQAREPGYFTEEHQRLLTLVASRVAISVENARLYTRLSRQAQTLTVLNDISRELTSILNLDQLLKRIGDLLLRLMDYQMFSILLLDENNSLLQHRFSLRFRENVQIKQDIPVGKGLVGYAAQHGQAVLVPDVSKDARYIAVNPETRSELCVPLIYKERVIGVLDLEHTRRNYFNEDHVRTLNTMAAQIAIAIENARLYERIAQQERRLEHDMEMARELQSRLLPAVCPSCMSAEVAARSVPALTIGGDLYDFLPYSNGTTGIALGDVSGKGAPAALYAALVSGILRSKAPQQPSPAQMLKVINRSLSERKIAAQYVSMLYAVWEDDQRLMRIANSGAPRPFFVSGEKIEIVQATGLPAGLFEDAQYDELTIPAKDGDLFVFFSDGIIDALNQDGEQFGRSRLEKTVARLGNSSAAEMVKGIFKAVEVHRNGVEPFDDETVVALKVLGDGKPSASIGGTKRTKKS